MNPNKIPYLNYQDVQISDLDTQKRFDDYMAKGQYAEAIATLKTNEDKLKGKALVADTINKLTIGAMELEGRFIEGVPVFLTDIANQIFAIINQYKMIGPWKQNVEYKAYNFVSEADKTYMAIQDVPANIGVANAAYWLKLDLKGEIGQAGLNVTLGYNWNPNTNYPKDCIVSYNNVLYVSKQPNKGITPGTPSALNYWMVFVVIGKGEIIVSNVEPINPGLGAAPNDTIWFKTETDPLNARLGVNGVLQVRDVDGWIELYPMTMKPLVNGLQNYYPKAISKRLYAFKERWVDRGNHYEYRYVDADITDDAQVLVYPGSSVSMQRGYGLMTMEKVTGGLIFSIDQRPNSVITMDIKIRKKG